MGVDCLCHLFADWFLDEETEAEIMQLFEEINKKQEVTIILITHNLELAGRAQKKMRMTRGRLATL